MPVKRTGGQTYLFSYVCTETFRNHGWASISSTPLLVPSLLDSSLHNKPLSSYLSQPETFACGGNVIFLFIVPQQISFGSQLQNGGRPVINQYNKAPKQQKSTGSECPFLWQLKIYFNIISGGIYSGLPQNEYAFSLQVGIPGFASPKSAILMCPSRSISIFSGLKSLYTIPFRWIYWSPNKISTMQNLETLQFMILNFLTNPKSSPPGQNYKMNMRLFVDSKANFKSIRNGCLSFSMIFFQFITIFFFLFFTIKFLSITFIAQNFPSSLNLHKQTFENPPLPIQYSISKEFRLIFCCLSFFEAHKFNVYPLRKLISLFFKPRQQSIDGFSGNVFHIQDSCFSYKNCFSLSVVDALQLYFLTRPLMFFIISSQKGYAKESLQSIDLMRRSL